MSAKLQRQVPFLLSRDRRTMKREETPPPVLVSSILWRLPPRNLRRGILVDRAYVRKRKYDLASLLCLDQLRRLSIRFVKSLVLWRKFVSSLLQYTFRLLCKGQQFCYWRICRQKEIQNCLSDYQSYKFANLFTKTVFAWLNKNSCSYIQLNNIDFQSAFRLYEHAKFLHVLHFPYKYIEFLRKFEIHKWKRERESFCNIKFFFKVLIFYLIIIINVRQIIFYFKSGFINLC